LKGFFIFCLLLVCQFVPLHGQDKEDPCPLSDNKKARKLYEKALDVARSDKTEARSILKEALDLDSEFGRANFVMAVLLIKQKRVADAEPYLRTVARVCPDLDPMVFFRLGSIAFENKNWKESQGFLKTFVDSRSKKEAEKSEARTMIQA
jgi:tetratricopeptide (TPR) repeat protein